MSNERSEKVDYGLRAGEWQVIFRHTGVEAERLNSAKSDRGRATIMGNFLGRQLNREVGIDVDGRTGKATLRSRPSRGATTLYYFEVLWDAEQQNSANQPTGDPISAGESQPARPATTARSTSTGPGFTPPSESPTEHGINSGLTMPGNSELW